MTGSIPTSWFTSTLLTLRHLSPQRSGDKSYLLLAQLPLCMKATSNFDMRIGSDSGLTGERSSLHVSVCRDTFLCATFRPDP